ncbi:MAG TPA: conjugal transfer protein TraC, partial [Rickettsia endosymbiont of Omalisus fontisbellaquei]|nr:conjugal transfer protein TraC [Rickettsia endosymbiont of Omalisus fontisbellaquei]
MKAHIHKDFTRESLSKHFVYESYDEETEFFFNRGSVGFVLFGWALVGANLQAQNEIEEFLKSEENLPAGSSMQVLMIGSSRIDEFLINWQSYRRGEIFCELAKKRVEFLRQKAIEEGTIKDIVLLISITVPSLNADLNEMDSRREALKNTFSSIGLKTENVNAEKLLTFVRIIFGWSEEEHEEINPHEILSRQVLPRDFALYEDDNLVMLNESHAFIALEAAKRPSEWRLSLMDLFLGNEMRKGEYIKSNFLIHFGLQILPNQLSARSTAITKREALGRNIAAG